MFLLSAGSALGGIVITVTPAISPNYVDVENDVDSMNNPTNPSLGLWQENALYALQNGLSSYCGNGSGPACYVQQNTVYGMQSVAGTDQATTGYTLPSWRGQVTTNSNYINETGNSVRYGVVITDTGGTFTLSQLGFGYTDNQINPNTSSPYISGGVAAGGYVGTGNSAYDLTGFIALNGTTVETSENAPLTELIFAGSGFSTTPQYCSDPSSTCTAAEEQAALDGTASNVGISSDSVTGTYFLVDDPTSLMPNTIATGSSTFTITPEPSTWFLMISAVPVIGAIRRRRQSRG